MANIKEGWNMTSYNQDNNRKTSAHESNNDILQNKQTEQNSANDRDQEELKIENAHTSEIAQKFVANEEEIKVETDKEIKPDQQAGVEKDLEQREKFPKTFSETEIVTEYEEKTAGFWIRFWAFITDGLIVTAIVSILVKPIFYMMGWNLSSSVWYAPITIISGFFYYGYFVLMTKYWQQTVGKMIFGLKVKSLKEQKLSWSTVLFRELVSRFINNTIWLPYIAVAFTPKKQGLQDYIADTIVVHEKVYVKNEKKVIKEKMIESNHQTV